MNLIRAVAATAVLVSHAWPITLGVGTPDLLGRLTGKTLGSWAVEVFFVVSGFLIAASFARRPHARAFLAARGLRLFPGLFVSLVLVAFVMGPLVTTVPLSAYLTDPDLSSFLMRNMALISPLYTLPGVFETNPYPSVEGSIWTLVHEVVCYMGILAIGLLGAFRGQRRMAGWLFLFALIWTSYAIFGAGLHPKVDQLHQLSLPFAIGVLVFALRHILPIILWVAVVLWAIAFVLGDSPLAFPIQIAALAYSVFWLAYVPRGPLQTYNKLGDYSYGIYIYAFPIQGLMVWLLGPMTPEMNIALALPATVLFAVMSWHLVEKPSLAMLRRY